MSRGHAYDIRIGEFMSSATPKSTRRLTIGVGLGLVAAVAGVWLFYPGSAQAAEIGGEPVTSGSVVVGENTNVTVSDVRTPGTVSPLTTKNIGGGTWNYGSGLSFPHPKTCWSNYIHNSKYHSSTAIIANSNVKVYANAGSWSNASTWAGAAWTCNAYWATY